MDQLRCVCRHGSRYQNSSDSRPCRFRNHPILAADGVLLAFLTEQSFETWKKHSSAISYDEESVSKRIDRVEEMSIPADLEEKME